ncbi:MAG TPA: acetate/propionate family kinase [Pirellulales bacterium]|jgi:acetate kinase|nr:acetate/propionate family kinase [Pirellulales bacterium]
MKILVANLGSTSFKYRLFDMDGERQLARGGTERIGSAESRSFVEIGGQRHEMVSAVPDHAVAVRRCLEQLTDPQHGCLKDAAEVAAIGFKAVHGGVFSGVQRVTPAVLAAMETMSDVAPAHNPPYITAMRLLSQKLPEIPLVAAFETGFHETIPDRLRYYAVPYEWAENHRVMRWGFHGASHRYIAGRTAELLGRNDLRIISCHLGGSNSLCAIRNGQSMANSLGMSPQSGLLHNNRVGDFDPFALPVLMKETGKSLAEILKELDSKSGLLGLSGLSSDVRDLEEAAAQGDTRARLALDVFVTSIRHYLGAYLVELGGAGVIVFTGGIGENSVAVRTAVCAGLEAFGIELDPEANTRAKGECSIGAPGSRTQIWVIPTNEELVVARQAKQLIEESK